MSNTYASRLRRREKALENAEWWLNYNLDRYDFLQETYPDAARLNEFLDRYAAEIAAGQKRVNDIQREIDALLLPDARGGKA